MRKHILGVGIGIVLGFAISPTTRVLLEVFVPLPASISVKNTEIINKVGQISDQLYVNSDIMQRFSHYVNDNHSTMLCPECSGAKTPAPSGDFTHTSSMDGLSSLGADAKEIDSAMNRIISSLTNQHVTLLNALRSMREKN